MKNETTINHDTATDGKPPVSGSYSAIQHSFKSRSSAEQTCKNWIEQGRIKSYRISWDTQNRMTVEVLV